MSKINHVLGISGGKDSAALAIYMNENYPELDINFYTCDTGKELKETYDLIDRLNSVLGRPITLYKSINTDSLKSFIVSTGYPRMTSATDLR